jgi:hypothetical protein
MYKQQRKKRNTQEKFRRRKISLVSKVDDLYRFFGADVFLAIRKRGKLDLLGNILCAQGFYTQAEKNTYENTSI